MPMIPGAPPMAGPLPAGPADPMMGPPGRGAPRGGAPPTVDPMAVQALLGPLLAQQQADLGAFQAQQEQVAAMALAEAMRNQTNPAAAASVSLPGGPVDPLARLAGGDQGAPPPGGMV